MHINVDSIFERERQTDAVVMEILLILEVITAKKRQTFSVGADGCRWNQHIFGVELQTHAGGNIPSVVPWVQRQM